MIGLLEVSPEEFNNSLVVSVLDIEILRMLETQRIHHPIGVYFMPG